MRASGGFACRFDAGEAALAALLEAVQSRLTEIAGARDDLLAEDYHPSAPTIRAAGPQRSLADLCSRYPSPQLGLPQDMLEHAIAAVLRSGAEDVFFFPLRSGPHVHVVRVLVPGLEAATENGLDQLGPRALASLLRLGGHA